MFTIEQISKAHSKVKSGADFPAYIRDLITLGVKGYDTFVNDGHVEYYGANNYRATATDKYATISVAANLNKERFLEFLLMHQEGQTDYLTFCNHAAQCGIARWRVDILEMACTYFDVKNNSIIVEKIPL